ncbi:hypothetical protein JB92DRAFT_2824478 [Gautieria morchelliformis]|nr:hypothetical protein JB92DRAFT_2824478 [Gautieria morchelliformis]
MSMTPESKLEELSKSIAVENTIDKHDSETSPSESTSELVEQEKDCESTPHRSDDHNDDDDFQPRGPKEPGIVKANDAEKEKERRREAKKEEEKRRDEGKQKREAEKRANTKA